MNQHIKQLQNAIEPLRNQLLNHKVYAILTSREDLSVFMEYHVYAVWDFMSLLKALQNGLTCTSVPWFPRSSGDIRYLINEIVAGEESDIDHLGVRMSHFELYLAAMEQSGADASKINCFLSQLQAGQNFDTAFAVSNTPREAKAFVEFTFDIIGSNKDYLQAAIFTFGREDLIPGMFISLITDLNQRFPDSISVFKYYLERHIAVDGGHHSQLALQMIASLCGEKQQLWMEAERVCILALRKRIELWDGIYEQISARKALVAK